MVQVRGVGVGMNCAGFLAALHVSCTLKFVLPCFKCLTNASVHSVGSSEYVFVTLHGLIAGQATMNL